MYFVLRTEIFAKLFFLVSCAGLFLYISLAFYTFHTAYTTIGHAYTPKDYINVSNLDLRLFKNVEFINDRKYILFWTQFNDNLDSTLEGQQIFTDHRCEYTNCFVTINKTMIKNDYTNFDAIVFNISAVTNWITLNMPEKRSRRQKFVFYSQQPSDGNPICNINADYYFNWTWTYKLNSDIVSPFIEVTNLQGNVVAPKLNVRWLTNNTQFTEDKTNGQMKAKRKTIAWIMNKCNGKNNREKFIRELQVKFEMSLLDFDIYSCGNLQCPPGDCSQVISKYYFYLVYEDKVAEDYVTQEVIKAYNHGAIPIILGGANYGRFLPDGSYIKAQYLTADQITAKVDYIVKNSYVYHSYFNWRKIYSIQETEELKGFCDLCAYLNDERIFGRVSIYKKFRKWWSDGNLYNKCIS